MTGGVKCVLTRSPFRWLCPGESYVFRVSLKHIQREHMIFVMYLEPKHDLYFGPPQRWFCPDQKQRSCVGSPGTGWFSEPNISRVTRFRATNDVEDGGPFRSNQGTGISTGDPTNGPLGRKRFLKVRVAVVKKLGPSSV